VSKETANRCFDELASGLASGSISRGRALRLMGAALVGGTLGLLGVGGVAGADPPGCKRNGKHCKRNTQCCSFNCSSSGTCVLGDPNDPCTECINNCLAQGGGTLECESACAPSCN
jgi:hypothetical protein